MNRLPTIEEEWISSIQQWAANEPLIEGVYIFGSRVKGTHRPNSDFDIAVLVHGADAAERDSNFICNAARWRKSLSAILPVPVHLCAADPAHDKTVWPAIAEHGQKLFPTGTLASH